MLSLYRWDFWGRQLKLSGVDVAKWCLLPLHTMERSQQTKINVTDNLLYGDLFFELDPTGI